MRKIHRTTKDAKVSDLYYSELRDLRIARGGGAQLLRSLSCLCAVSGLHGGVPQDSHGKRALKAR